MMTEARTWQSVPADTGVTAENLADPGVPAPEPPNRALWGSEESPINQARRAELMQLAIDLAKIAADHSDPLEAGLLLTMLDLLLSEL